MTQCLVYSVKNHPNHLSQLKRSLTSVRDYVMPFVHDMDIVYFYDEGTQQIILGFMRELGMRNNVFLRQFTAGPLDYPPHIKEKIVGNKSYNNMCRFWAGVVFTDPQVGQYDYYMRLDCDSFFTRPIGRDIFAELSNTGAIYGYFPGGIQHDDSPYSQDLNKTIKEFEVQYKGKLFGTIDDVLEGMLYYTNFEICNTKAFLNSGYMDLFRYLDNSGGIYMYRWGDHIIRYAGVHLFWPKGAAYEIPGCSYTHQVYSIVDGKLVSCD